MNTCLRFTIGLLPLSVPTQALLAQTKFGLASISEDFRLLLLIIQQCKLSACRNIRWGSA